MIPTRLALKNFISYRGQTEVDFEGIHLACLSGDNGAGKSALLDAITWALWGQSRARSDRDLVTLQESEMDVTFEFRIRDQEFRVFRRRSGAANRLSLEFHSRSADGDDWHAITGDNASDTQDRINAAIRMDYETFINSAFLLQGQADTFTQKTPGDRKRILGEILGLREYDELATLAREHARQTSGRLELVREQIVAIEVELAEHSNIDDEVAAVEEELTGVRKRLDEIERERARTAERVHSLRSLAQVRARAARRRDQSKTDQGKLEASIKKAREDIARLDAFIKREREIEEGYRELGRIRAEVQAHNNRLQKLTPLQDQRTQLQKAIQAERESLNQKIRVGQERRDSLSKRLGELGGTSKELADLEDEKTRIEKEIRDLEPIESKREKTGTQISELRAENKTLRQKMTEVQDRIAAVEEGHATCPICRRPLTEHDHEEIKAHWMSDGKDLGDAYRANQAEIKKLEVIAAEHEVGAIKLRKLREHLAGVAARHKELNRQVGARPELEKQLRQTSKDIEATQSQFKNEDFARDARSSLVNVEKAIADLAYDAREHEAANESLSKLEHFDEQHRHLERSRIQRQALDQGRKENQERLESVIVEVSNLDEEIKTLDEQLGGLDDLEKSYKKIVEEAETIAKRRQELDQQRATLVARQQHLKNRAQEKVELRNEERQLARDADAYRELVTAFGRNGIQTTIIESVIPELQDEANALLRRMSPSYLEVTLSTSRQAQTRDRLIDTLDIIIHDEQGERPYEMYSGGEAFRINFAIRIALSKLLAKRAGATIDLLVIDEGFGTQDASGREGLIDALRSIEAAFAMILVITHIDEVRDMFPTRIEVTKTSGGSHVRVN